MSSHVRTVVRRSPGGAWESITRPPSDPLRAYVHDYDGYDVTPTAEPSRHVPPPYVPMILGFGGTMRMRDPAGGLAEGGHQTFVAGMHDTWVDSTTEGRSTGVQVNLTPIGAYMFIGRPMSEVAGRVIELEDIVGAPGRDFGERLAAAPDWDARMDMIDSLIEERLKSARVASPAIGWAWQQLVTSGGNVGVGVLAERIGWSRKHLTSRFREQVGLPPKTVGRVLRFNRVLRFMARGREMSWASIAMRCGYYDQAHLIRDFNQFAGAPPTEYLTRVRPHGAFASD